MASGGILDQILAEFAAQEGGSLDPSTRNQIVQDLGSNPFSGDGGDDHHKHHHHHHHHDHCLPCFLAGTRISTPSGEVRVENISRGDLVDTANGEPSAVRWIGRRKISADIADAGSMFPVRIKSGAMAENVPSRDLLVSPEHALMVEGFLIQAGALVNGVSIVPESASPGEFVYYHVELDRHDLIFAEGALAETFVDNVDRMEFDNWEEHQKLYPDGNPIAELPYPRAKAHRQVPFSVRRKIAARASELFWSVTSSAA